nr:hypothetical protein [Microbacterium amylolyticum]
MSFFPLVSYAMSPVRLAGYLPVWSFGLSWIPAVGLPVAAATLIVLRRFASQIRGVGGLSIDQFASVSFIAAAYAWFDIVFSVSGAGYVLATGWIAILVALAGVFFTVFARFVPPFQEDFVGRDEVQAHITARPARPLATPAPRPVPVSSPAPAPYSAEHNAAAQPPFAPPAQEAPASDAQIPDVAESSEPSTTAISLADLERDLADQAPGAQQDPTEVVPDETGEGQAEGSSPEDELVPDDAGAIDAPVADEGDSGASSAPVATDLAERESGEQAAAQEQTLVSPEAETHQQPFWALVPAPRNVYDVNGQQSFVVGPTAWALVLEDRGDVFVVRHDDGRIGYLYDTSGVTRG